MWTLWVVVLMIVGAAPSAPAGDGVYESRDATGRKVYSDDPGTPRSADEPGSAADGGSGSDSDADAPSGGVESPEKAATAASAQDAGASAGAATGASIDLRRRAVEREYRTVARQLSDVDGKLERLAHARTHPNAAVEDLARGLQVDGRDYRSDDELRMAPERDRLARRADELRKEYETLRSEATKEAAGSPPNWPNLR